MEKRFGWELKNFNMATYPQIQRYVKQKYGIIPSTCYIADAKRKCGLKVRVAHNRKRKDGVMKPCPKKYLPKIEDALRYFNML